MTEIDRNAWMSEWPVGTDLNFMNVQMRVFRHIPEREGNIRIGRNYRTPEIVCVYKDRLGILHEQRFDSDTIKLIRGGV